MATNIASALGVGSGIDTGQLVRDLVSAVREPKASLLNSRVSLNNAKISALASASSSLDTFSKALTTTLESAGFAGQPVSNDPSIVTSSLITGGVPQGLPAQVEVRQLAAAQNLVSAGLPARTDAVGTGTLTLATAKGSFAITIDGTNNTLDGLAREINDADAGVTASVIVDNQGARLVVKGATGADQAFTLTNAGDADADLLRFKYDGAPGGMSRVQEALDSIVTIDNVEVHNSTNVLKDTIPYVRLDLNKAAVGTKVTIASNEPTTTVRDLVTEFVQAYNTLRTALNAATAPGLEGASGGALAGDAGVRDMVRQLSRLTSTDLTDTGAYRTLTDLGVKTNRDGTLTLDTARLDAAIAADPGAVARMLNPAVVTDANPGIAGALKKVRDTVQQADGSLATSKRKFETLRASYAEALEKLNLDMENYESRLSATYAAMDKQLTALNATKSYIEQQIKVWNNDNN